MPPMPPGPPIGAPLSFSGMSAISASVVSSRPAIETAFCTAERVTFTGSITLNLSFGDKGWDSAEYLADVPLNETLFSHNADVDAADAADDEAPASDEFHVSVDGDSVETSFNEVDDQVSETQMF